MNCLFGFRFDSVWRMVEDIPHQFDCEEDIQMCNDLL